MFRIIWLTKPKIEVFLIGNNLFEYDELKMYFGEDYVVTNKITIRQPTIGEIIEFGEKKYFSIIRTLTCIPSDMKSQLFDNGIDYMEISDFELFMIMSRSLTYKDTCLILKDIDLSKFIITVDPDNNENILYDPINDIEIDQLIYLKIVKYLRKLHNIKPKIEHAANKTTKRILIQLERDEIEKNKNKPYKSQFFELISGIRRFPGFQYTKEEIKKMNLYEFMDFVRGAQIYVSSTALLKGMYSGMMDISKIDKEELNWMRAMDENS